MTEEKNGCILTTDEARKLSGGRCVQIMFFMPATAQMEELHQIDSDRDFNSNPLPSKREVVGSNPTRRRAVKNLERLSF